MCNMLLMCPGAKLPNLELKTQTKEHLDYFLSAYLLPIRGVSDSEKTFITRTQGLHAWQVHKWKEFNWGPNIKECDSLQG
jgi:hypothetical protein